MITKEKYEKIFNYISKECPELIKAIEYEKDKIVQRTVKEVLTAEKLYAIQCSCFLEAAATMNHDVIKSSETKKYIKEEFEKMNKGFSIFLNEEEFCHPHIAPQGIKFNWDDIYRYIDELAFIKGYKKLSITDKINVSLCDFDKTVIILEDGPLGPRTHYAITILGSICGHYRYNPVCIYMKD